MKKTVDNNDIMTLKSSIVTEQWKNVLKQSGYEHSVSSSRDILKIKKFSRLWRRILKYIHMPAQSKPKILEIGCGGGKHIASFALNNWKCTGIDCSEDVLERAARYLDAISNISQKSLDVNLFCSDVQEFNTSDRFDIVFHVGVLEHFLNTRTRLTILKKMFDFTKCNGYVIHVVPNGVHPARYQMRLKGLGGYDIPEIDYDCKSLADELRKSLSDEVVVLPHNLFSYLLYGHHGRFKRIINAAFYYTWQIVPMGLLPAKFSFRYAGTLIGIAKKTASP